MKLEFKFDWTWVLVKSRILFLLCVFYILYFYLAPVFAHVWLGYFVLSELAEIIEELEKQKEERAAAWTSISSKRKQF